MELYTAFYRRHGLRKIDHLMSPPMALISTIKLPKESLLHYVDWDEVSYGPDMDFPLLKTFDGRHLVGHVTELGSNAEGNPRPNRSTPASRLERDFYRRQRKLRPLHDFGRSDRSETTLITENYAMLPHLYIYMRSIYSNYHKNRNVLRALFERMAQRADISQRQQFLMVELPKTVPGPATFKKAEASGEQLSKNLLETFSTNRHLMLLELWTWLGENRGRSLINAIKPEHYDRINLLWSETGHVCCMNLGTLLSFFNQDVEDDADNVGSTRMQRALLKFCIRLLESRTNHPVSEPAVDEEEIVHPTDSDDENDDIRSEVDEEDLDEDAVLERDLERLDQIQMERDLDIEADEFFDLEPAEGRDRLKKHVDDLAEGGSLSPAQHRRLERLIGRFEELDNPYGEGKLNEWREIKPEDVQLDAGLIDIPKIDGVTDESMLQSTLKAFDRQYIERVMDKDIANAALAMTNAGVIVTDYNVETVEDAANHYRLVTMKIQPVGGEQSTIRFRVPVIDKDGQFLANNVKYRLRKQRADRPIRKVAPNQVALTSYYAKAFVTRSEKSVVNYPKWLNGEIMARALDDDDATVLNVKHTSTYINTVKLPRIYTILAQRFREITLSDQIRIFVDYQRRESEFGIDKVAEIEKDGFVLCGTAQGKPLVVDQNSSFYKVNGAKLELLGQIEDLVGLDRSKAPTEIVEFQLYTRNIPLVFALGRRYGLQRLIRTLGVGVRRVPVGSRLDLADNEYAVRFADESLVFIKDDPKATMILAGMNRYHRTLRRYNVDAFDDPEVYTNVLEDNGIRIGLIRELDLAMEMFVDPITEQLLRSMGEPTTLDGLMIRSVELLTTDDHPDETDMASMRIRGYERMAGAVYSEMARAVRKYRSRGVGTNSKIEMNPEAVWITINSDPAIAQVEESNPIQNLKEQELVTYMGVGGRSSQTMVKRTRKYHKSDMGIISESTPDSNTVGVNAYLSANPQLQDLRGLGKEYDPKTTKTSSMISTSALLAPAADVDDPKRVNFISIQNAHVVAADGYRPTPMRTGYEKVMAHRVSDLYAYTAKGDGEIIKIDKHALRIQYKDGTEDHVELGTRYGSVVGVVVPHQVVCDLAVGSKVTAGDVVAFNTGFFERDPLDRRQVLFKTSIMAKTAIMERSHTFEDASVISERLANEIGTQITKVRTIVVNFDQKIRDLTDVGTKVDTETILCMIEEAVTSDSDMFDDDSLDLLKTLSANAPKAKAVGTVERIEVFYHGDLEDASDSLRKLATQSDKERIRRLKALGKTPTTGEVDGFVRIDKDPLDLNTMAIRIYITGTVTAGIGDKGVFANQMKTIFSYIMSGTNETESGVPLDAFFGYMSISNRIVLSPEVMGTTNSLLMTMSKKVSDEYFKKKGS